MLHEGPGPVYFAAVKFWSDIYFKCPCCRKQLVVERAAAGGEAPCPGCRSSLRIPQRSGLPPKLVRRVSLIALNAAAVVALTAAGVQLFGTPARKPAPVRISTPLERALRDRQVAPPLPGLPMPPAGRKAPPPGPTAMDELSAKNTELVRRNLALTTQFEGMAAWVLDNYQGKYPLPLDLVSRLRIPPVSSNFTVSGEIASFLKITPAEQRVLDESLVSTREKLAKTEASLVSVSASDDNSVTLYVPPFETLGTAMREDLYGTLETTLGAPRFDKFVDVSKQELEEAYHYFGAAARGITISLMPQQGGDAAYLMITDGWQVRDSESVTKINGKQTATREIPAEYSGYLNLLPPNIAAFPVQANGG